MAIEKSINEISSGEDKKNVAKNTEIYVQFVKKCINELTFTFFGNKPTRKTFAIGENQTVYRKRSK